MYEFKYRALNNSSYRIVLGKMEAPSELALEQMLGDNNLTLISSKLIVPSKLSSILAQKITTKDLIMLFITLEQLERSGISLLESLKDIKNITTNQNLKDIMQNVYEAVKSGSLLSEAIAKYPIFDEVMINLIAMGEKTGNLDIAMKNIVNNLKWGNEISRKVKKALAMPLFSLLTMLGACLVLLKVVVPKILEFILEQGIKVPIYTEYLVSTSEFVAEYFLFFIIVPVVIVFTVKISCKNYKIALKFDQLKLKLPIFGDVITKINISRFTKFFGLTYTSGVQILECIKIANNVTTNKAIKEDIEKIRGEISDGQTMSSCLAGSAYFPVIVVKMFKVGEESGNLEESMENIQYFYDMEISDTISKVIATIQPTILFVMGIFMVWIIAAVFGPIYGNFSNMLT